MQSIYRNSTRLILSLIAFLFLHLSPVYAKRVALVIGTDSYENLSVLEKAVNDARAISDVLKEIGFDVIKGENLTRRQMNRSLADLERSISPGDQVFFFFAGHGVALGATNYLIPADMPLPQNGEESLVRGEAFAVDEIVARVQSRGAKSAFVVLDACRNNPFTTRGVRSIGATRGLRDISTPKGVFVLFSAGIGQLALDHLGPKDTNPNSVFTRHLVPLLKEPGLSHVQLAKRVQSEVDKLAKTIRHEQQPAYYDQVIGNMYLNNQKRPQIKTARIETKVVKKSDTKSTPQSDITAAERAFKLIQKSEHVGLLEAFVQKYPDSFYANIISARLQDLKARKIILEQKKQEAISNPGVNKRLARLKEAERKWALLKSSSDINALKEFAGEYSDTAFASVAHSRVELLGEMASLKKDKKQATTEHSDLYNARIEEGRKQWEILKYSKSIDDLSTYIDRYPDLVFSKLAFARLQEVKIDNEKKRKREANQKLENEAYNKWIRIGNSTDKLEFREFLRVYGNTTQAAKARRRINYLDSHTGRAEIAYKEIEFVGSRAQLEEFIRLYGNTRFSYSIRKRLDKLKQRDVELKEKTKHEAKHKREKEAFSKWASLRGSTDKLRIRGFLRAYGDTSHAVEARKRISYLESHTGRAEIAYQGLGIASTRAQLEEFVRLYGATQFGSRARHRLNLMDSRETSKLLSDADKSFDKKQYKKSFRLYKQAFDKGNKNAAFRLGYLYHTGNGVRKNFNEAIRLYRIHLTNKPNDAPALNNLANMYHQGEGLRRNYKEAAALYYRAMKKDRGGFVYKQLTTKPRMYSKQTRREIQRLLKNDGHYNGAIDGSIGPGTKRALNKLGPKLGSQ